MHGLISLLLTETHLGPVRRTTPSEIREIWKSYSRSHPAAMTMALGTWFISPGLSYFINSLMGLEIITFNPFKVHYEYSSKETCTFSQFVYSALHVFLGLSPKGCYPPGMQ